MLLYLIPCTNLKKKKSVRTGGRQRWYFGIRIFSFRITVHPSLPYVNATFVRARFHKYVRIVVIWKPSMRVVCNTELMYKSHWCLEPYCDLNVYMAVRWQMVHIRPPRSHHCYISICSIVAKKACTLSSKKSGWIVWLSCDSLLHVGICRKSHEACAYEGIQREGYSEHKIRTKLVYNLPTRTNCSSGAPYWHQCYRQTDRCVQPWI